MENVWFGIYLAINVVFVLAGIAILIADSGETKFSLLGFFIIVGFWGIAGQYIDIHSKKPFDIKALKKSVEDILNAKKKSNRKAS